MTVSRARFRAQAQPPAGTARQRPQADRCGYLAALIGLCLGLLALGPGIAPGYLLNYDMVFVPRPAFNAALAGASGVPPRAVPSDFAVAVLARLLPADLVQKLVLLAIFTVACAGAAALLAGEHRLARLTAGVFYAWNPFVAERLLLGQWALLLGYAGLPWVARAVTRPDGTAGRFAGRLAVAVLPAAIGGFGGMVISAPLVVAGPLCAPGVGWRQRVQRACTGAGVLAAGSLPWLLPALTHPVHTSPAGVAAFAGRADTPFGAVGSLLMLGGAWNSQTVPAGYGGGASVIWLAVVALGAAGFVLVGRTSWPGLAIAAVAGLGIACLGISAPGQALLRQLIGAWPGFAVLRDGQQFIAPLALAEAAGLGLAVASMLHARPPRIARDTRVLLALVALILPLVAVPGLAWGAGGTLRPVQYPAQWLAARQLLSAARPGGKVLLLPWASYRRYEWNGGRPVLDPWPRLLAATVIWNDAVQVGNQVVPSEDPAVRALGPLLAPGSAGGPAGPPGVGSPLTNALLAAGVRYVIVDAGFGAHTGPAGSRAGLPYQARLPGARVLIRGPALVLYELQAVSNLRAKASSR